MNLGVWIVGLTSFIFLIIFDFQRFTEAKESVRALSELSELLNIRGRARYELNASFNDAKRHKPFDLNAFRTKTTAFFESGYSITLRSPILLSWPKLEEYRVYQAELAAHKKIYEQLNVLDGNASNDISSWVEKSVSLIDEIQILNYELSKYLSRQLEVKMRHNVLINLAWCAITLIILFMLNNNSQKRLILEQRRTNDDLNAQKNQLLSVRRIMKSLLEDLNAEKELVEKSYQKIERANANLEQKNTEMEQFVYTVSHDLKSPLVTISGFSKRLEIELMEHLNDKQKHKFQRISENIHTMEGLLKDLLELSRVIKSEVVFNDVEVSHVVESVKSSLERDIEKANAKIRVKGEGLSVVSHERLLFQCLQNLISNAIRYRDPSRPLVIQIFLNQEDGFSKLSVKDNGIGIEEKHFKKIFRIFERLNVNASEGSGVGLSIVSAIMEKHGGKVSVDSKFGRGSIFSLYFPNKSK